MKNNNLKIAIILITGSVLLGLNFNGFSQNEKGNLNSRNKSFTIVEVPGSYNDLNIISKQFNWIKDNKDLLNIRFVVHSGDMLLKGHEEEWLKVHESFNIIDGIFPYCIATGNHDLYSGKGQNRGKSPQFFNRFFPAFRFNKMEGFEGNFKNTAENTWFKFENGKQKLLFLCLEFGVPDSVITWANKIIEKHPGHTAIIITHYFTNSSDAENNYSWHPMYLERQLNDRTEIWEKLVSRHKNIPLVLSSHYKGVRRETSLAKNGNWVHQLLTNYLDKNNNEHGWLRIIQFNSKKKTISFKTYSPILNRFLTDDENEFVLDYE